MDTIAERRCEVRSLPEELMRCLELTHPGWAGVAMDKNGVVFIYDTVPRPGIVSWLANGTDARIPALDNYWPEEDWKITWTPFVKGGTPEPEPAAKPDLDESLKALARLFPKSIGVAMDENGQVYTYLSKPIPTCGIWSGERAFYGPIDELRNFWAHQDWELTWTPFERGGTDE